MGRAARLNKSDTVAQKDGFSLKKDASGYAIFIPQSEDVVKPRAIVDSFGFSRHELGAPEIDAERNGILIAICPRIQYTCCPAKTKQWSEACEEGFGPVCPEHGGNFEAVYEQTQATQATQATPTEES